MSTSSSSWDGVERRKTPRTQQVTADSSAAFEAVVKSRQALNRTEDLATETTHVMAKLRDVREKNHLAPLFKSALSSSRRKGRR